MTRIHTDRKIRENPSDLCNPCSLPGRVFYPAQRGFAAGGAVPVEARGEGAGIWGEGGVGGYVRGHDFPRQWNESNHRIDGGCIFVMIL
jgi:hypothetical protein